MSVASLLLHELPPTPNVLLGGAGAGWMACLLGTRMPSSPWLLVLLLLLLRPRRGLSMDVGFGGSAAARVASYSARAHAFAALAAAAAAATVRGCCCHCCCRCWWWMCCPWDKRGFVVAGVLCYCCCCRWYCCSCCCCFRSPYSVFPCSTRCVLFVLLRLSACFFSFLRCFLPGIF